MQTGLHLFDCKSRRQVFSRLGLYKQSILFGDIGKEYRPISNPAKYCMWRVPWLYLYWPCGLMLFVVLCPGTPEGSTGSGSGFKASQKTGQRLKVSSDRLGEAGNESSDQGLHCLLTEFSFKT